MSAKLFRGTGAEGWGKFTWAQLWCVMADMIKCRMVRDDEAGTGTEFLQTVFDAAAKYNRGGKVLHVDKDGRRITAKHLRLGAASIRLKELFQASRRDAVDQPAIAGELKKDFALEVKDALDQELSVATWVNGKIGDVVNVASRVISLSIRRQDQEFKAADTRFIQVMRSLYKKSLAHIETIEASREMSFNKTGVYPDQSPQEQQEESHAWAIKNGFEQKFDWDSTKQPTNADALGQLGVFNHLLYHLGGEETMRGHLYDVKSCLNFLAERGVATPVRWSVIPNGHPQPSKPL